jgi:hypothetical protein
MTASRPAGRRLRRVLGLVLVIWLIALASYGLGGPLTVPVQGVSPRSVYRTFGARRGGGTRTHKGTDIFARRRTPVVAATRGIVVWRGELGLGGKALYVFGRAKPKVDRWTLPTCFADQASMEAARRYAVRNTAPRPLHLGCRGADLVDLDRGEAA